ncbi:MAG: Crp/Fnr family transcriptional regulator [bacterium]|nr:Crp/Fnr family transcriptional regulator [bacterium]
MAYESLLSQIPFFSQLSPESISELSRRINRRRYEKDQIIFHKDDPGSMLYIILSGKVKITLPSPEGENVIVAILSTGDFFGELSLFDGESRSATATATEISEILTLDQKEFIHYISENPKVSINILAELSRRLRRTDELLSDAAFCSLGARLAKRILELSERYGEKISPKSTRLNLKLKQQDLADMVGATRESVNKMLRDFRSKEIIDFQKGIITILDRDALEIESN